MDTTVQLAIISAAVTFIFQTATAMWNQSKERKQKLHQRELEHYLDLVAAISDLAIDDVDKNEANLRFARAANTIALVAPQPVIAALMEFHEEVRVSNPERSLELHDAKLVRLLLEIRKSLKLPFKDVPETFRFHLIGKRCA